MAKITYDDKSYLNLNGNIPNVNKVTDNDMNEIKSVVNTNYDAMMDELYYKNGDTIELGNNNVPGLYVASGLITGSTQSVLVTLVTPKRLDNITSITINSINVEARGISGYLNSESGYIEYVGKSGYTITAWVSSLNTIGIRITKSSAFTNVNNNTPITLDGYFAFTLS